MPGVAEFNEDAPPITDDLLVFFDPDYGVFSDEGNSLAADGDNIRQIWDRASTGNTLNQTSASAQPIYDTTTLGNDNASIKSINDSLILTSEFDFDNSTSFTFYQVYKKASNTNIYYWLRGAAGYPRSEHRPTLFQIRGNTGSGRYVNYTDNTDIKIMAITVDRSANEFKMYINGSYIGASVSSVTNWPVTISKLYGNGNAIMNTGNVLFYTDAHDATQVLQVSEWLGEKYDLLVAPITENLEFYINPDKEVYSDAGTTLATDGDNIRQINDLSGNDNTLNQTTAASQPVYKTGVIGNGKASIQSNNDFFLTTNNIEIPNTQAEWTFYAVYKRSNQNNEYFISTLSTNASCRMEWRSVHQIRELSGSGRYIAFTDDTDTKIVTYTLDRNAGTVGELKMYVNGEFYGNMSAGSTVANWPLEFDKLFNSAYGINFGDQLMYNDAHSADQVETMSDWLNDKYDIY